MNPSKLPAALLARMGQAARLQVDLPEGRVNAPQRIFADRVPDLWTVFVEGTPRDQRSGAALLHAGAGVVTVPAGLDQAGRVLQGLRPLRAPAPPSQGRGRADAGASDWGGGLLGVINAAGGMTPGWPDYPEAQEERVGEGVRITLRLPGPWLAYAAAGGVGRPPSSTAGVVEPLGTATLDIGPDYALRWSYHLHGAELASFAGTPAAEPPALADAALLTLLQRARQRACAPRAVPLQTPVALPGFTGVYTVNLCALGPVHALTAGPEPTQDPVAAAGRLRALGVSLERPPALPLWLALLEAVGGLPPGLLASDLQAPQASADGVSATVDAALLRWAAGGAQGETPRAPAQRALLGQAQGQARLQVAGGALRWSLT